MTRYERAVYQFITASSEHPTAEQVFAALRDSYPAVSLATVYNNLNRLWAAGMIRKLSLEGSPDRYDRAEKHDHFVCSRCGRVMDLRLKDLTGSLRRQLGGGVESYDLRVYGLCPACRRERPGPAPDKRAQRRP